MLLGIISGLVALAGGVTYLVRALKGKNDPPPPCPPTAKNDTSTDSKVG